MWARQRKKCCLASETVNSSSTGKSVPMECGTTFPRPLHSVPMSSPSPADEPAQAVQRLQRLLAVRPDDIPLLRELARAHVRARALVPALETLDRVIELGG